MSPVLSAVANSSGVPITIEVTSLFGVSPCLVRINCVNRSTAPPREEMPTTLPLSCATDLRSGCPTCSDCSRRIVARRHSLGTRAEPNKAPPLQSIFLNVWNALNDWNPWTAFFSGGLILDNAEAPNLEGRKIPERQRSAAMIAKIRHV